MATKYASFHDNYRPSSSYNNQDYYIDIGYTETYNQAEKRSEVKLEVVQEKTTFNPGNCRFSGIVKFQTTGGTTVVTKTLSDSSCDITLSTSWSNVSNSSGGTGYIPYNTDGTASFVVRLEANQYTNFGAVFSGRALGIQSSNLPATLTVALPTHTSSLTVNPNGGTWGGSTSSQTFSQLPKTTKTVANPTRTGYAFSGWTRSGSTTGSISGTTYTFGDDGTTTTLTASWTINSYTVTCKDYLGSTSGTPLGTKTGSYNYGSSVSGASFGSSTTYDAYYTGYHYTSSSSAVTVPANNNTVVYRYFAKNTWTVSYNANGGSSTPASQTKTYGVALTLAAAISKTSTTQTITTTYNYNGNGKADTTASSTKTTSYSFKEWNTVKAGTGTAYAANESYTTNGAATMYAQWTTNSPTYSAVTLPSATRTGYTFAGWYDAASGGNKIGNAGASYSPTGNKTLYAHWTINTYTFKATAGTYIASVSLNGTSSATSVTKTVEYGSTNTFAATLGSHSAYTYSFDGWYNGTSRVSTSLTYTPASTASAALSLTAKATRTVKSYTLSLTKPNTGGSAEVRRTSSPNGGGSIGALNNGATIYYGDVLQVSYTENPGYEVETHTINGSTFTSPATVTVTGNATVVVSMKNAGVVWIYDGASWEKYIPMIWNGSSWDRYIPMVWTGSAWEIY